MEAAEMAIEKIVFYKERSELSLHQRVAFAIWNKDYEGLEFNLFLRYPVCSDVNSDKAETIINEKMEKVGWGIGMAGVITKDKMSPEELLSCLAFAKAYMKEVRENKNEECKYLTLKIPISEFLDSVDKIQRNIEHVLNEKYQRAKKSQGDIDPIKDILKKNEFKYFFDGI